MRASDMENYVNHRVAFWLCLSVSVGLMVGGFFAPPTGAIDSSVLYACGICFLFAALAKLPYMMKGHDVEIKHGDTSITITTDDDND